MKNSKSTEQLLQGIHLMEEGLKKVRTEIGKLDDPWLDDYSAILQNRLEVLKTGIEVEVIEVD
ncbi:hypothetical protein [Cecembia rubra]|uniref:Uncharacterized protein n=1 Tax=Cecembia rubra TaxID=1485585 RepID=A0A2P8E358_9BACT|nr:hypothetical protein [Cecembia rubra]PSL03886.1 hypothetical protein CLV48_106126 [Cecembia rubra]